MKTKIFFFLLISGLHVQAQNLVPNPSFEEYKKLDCWMVQYSTILRNQDPKKTFDSLLYFWILPTKSVSEVLSDLVSAECSANDPICKQCSSSTVALGIPPKDGHDIAAVVTVGSYVQNANGRSYIQTPLLSQLKPGIKYLAGYYHAAADRSKVSYVGTGEFVSNNLGMLLTAQPVGSDSNEMLEYAPQVNQGEVDVPDNKWKLLFDCFTVVGGEQYLTLGNFKTDSETEVKLVLKPYDNGSDYAFSLVDSVFVEEIKEPFIPNVITPNGDGLNEKFVIENTHLGWWGLDVYNRWGKSVYHSADYRNIWDGGNLNSGIYFYDLKHLCPDISYKGTLTICK